MKDRLQLGHDLYFVVQEEHRGYDAEQITLTSEVIERMIRNSQFKMNKVTVELSTKLATTEILLCLGKGSKFPISKFPRSLLQDEDARDTSKSSWLLPDEF